MKKGVLFISLSLFSVMLSAQHIHSIMNKKVQTELTRERIKSDRETQDARQQEEIKNKVNDDITRYKLERLHKAVETVSTYLLDEAVIEGQQKRTYTYSKDGKRDEEKYFSWRNETWNLDHIRKYDYQYDDQQRCIKRSISANGTETNRVEIFYEDGNRLFKYYELQDVDGLQKLVLTYEEGYDSEMREILNKRYNNEILESWQESKFNKNGEQIFSLHWNNSYGNKTETTINGLETIRNSYSWSVEVPEWTLDRKETTIRNENGRSTLEERISYYNGVMNGEKVTFGYDSYNRTISWMLQEYKNDVPVNRAKEEYTYWGTDSYGPDGNEDDFEGPLLTYNYYEWKNDQWKKTDYATITRNGEGIALSAVLVTWDETMLNGQEIETKEEAIGTYNEKGLLTLIENKIYRADNNTLLYKEKTETKYDNKNRRTLQSIFRMVENNWKLMEEDAREYDQQDRRIVESARYVDEETNVWRGEKTVFAYQDNITTTTGYSVDPNGEFHSTPNRFNSNGVLANGRSQDIYLAYDENGVITNGKKTEQQQMGLEIKLPLNPENYNDGIDLNLSEIHFDTSYSAVYDWRDGNWLLINERGCQQEGNDIILSYLENERVISKQIYSFDDNKNLVGMKEFYNEELMHQTIYEYNSDGLLSKMDQDGTITTYTYSKHDVTGVEKNTVAVLSINGRTITADNAEALLQVYSTSGMLIVNGTGTVTLPESGLYIVITDSIRQKIAIR